MSSPLDTSLKQERMIGLSKGLAIIESFGASRKGYLSISEAARLTGQNRSTARRCLLTLVDLGYLSFDGKHFRPEAQLLRLGAAYLSSARLPQVAQSLLDQIRDEMNESVILSIPEGDEIVMVARSWTQQILLTGATIGMRVAAYCSAGGQVWLASLSEAKLDEYLSRVPLVPKTLRTITDPIELKHKIAMVREAGYCLGEEELEVGVAAVAVPVVKPDGTFIASMVVSCSLSRKTSQELLKEGYPRLKRAAEILCRSV